MDVDAPLDLAPVLEAASEFASYPGLRNDASAKEFLDRFPLHTLFSVLQTKSDVPGIEDTMVSCLDKIFRTKYGASLLLDYAPFIQAGLQANSQTVRCLACKAVSYLLENTGDRVGALQIIVAYNVYPLLLSCLVDGDEQTSAASLEAVKDIAQSPEGIAHIRILALVAKLFSLSSSIATAVYNSNLLNLFEVEINNDHDMLTTLSALELLYELVESPHSSMFLLRTTLLQKLTSMISNSSVDSILRSRAALISGRILSSSDAYTAVDISSVTALLAAIDDRLKVLGGQNTDEYESALEALGLIGATSQGATLLLSSSPVARHVIESAFDRHNRGKQLAGLHALASICGVDRPEDKMLLDSKAEENLRRLIYTAAANTSKLNPSGLILSVLRQEPEIRLALCKSQGYRLISGLVVRPWCLMEICLNQEIITIVTDAKIETAKNGMDARHHCCTAISTAISSSNLLQDAAVARTAAKLQEAVRRGPYVTKEHVEAQPVVMTAERF
ncbi:Proteasome non-ATPase 26S subunit [Musa troglodytarum]|uniref:Proteasome non-ATPase 26S subunit n=1 Tax=Musa troglodytarum TaxID=320322 RepID=A0A9E7JTI2_9LILI|nr:Proteasome non-ATPase 26S subunit [Musa troglodytarum]